MNLNKTIDTLKALVSKLNVQLINSLRAKTPGSLNPDPLLKKLHSAKETMYTSHDDHRYVEHIIESNLDIIHNNNTNSDYNDMDHYNLQMQPTYANNNNNTNNPHTASKEFSSTKDTRDKDKDHKDSTNLEKELRSPKKHSQNLQLNKKIYRICLTGGPCAGKSSALLHIKQGMDAHNVMTIIVPEASTLLNNNFLSYHQFAENNIVGDFQMGLLQTQLALEGIFTEMAMQLINQDSFKKDVLIICDRGCMDGSAYMDTDEFISMIESKDWSISNLRDNRYDMVIHLTTAALGAEKYYTLENNTARSEDVEFAVSLDTKVKNAYLGHPRVKIVNNMPGKSFEDKLNKTLSHIEHMFNFSAESMNTYYKFLLKVPHVDDNGIPMLDNNVNYEQFFMDEAFLVCYVNTISKDKHKGSENKENKENKEKEGNWRKIRHRYSLQSHCYSFHTKIDNTQVKKLINARQYYDYAKNEKHATHMKIKKIRQVFHYEGSVMKLETIYKDNKVIYILRVTGERPEMPKIPNFLNIEKDITRDKEFSTYNLSSDSYTLDANKPYVKIIQNTGKWEITESNKGFMF